MFNNLIESSSHRKEFKRRGSFVLCTTITYALMLGASGLISIYAYDAHLDASIFEPAAVQHEITRADRSTLAIERDEHVTQPRVAVRQLDGQRFPVGDGCLGGAR